MNLANGLTDMFWTAWYNNAVTFGGFIVGASIIVFGTVRWWHKERPAWKPLIGPIICVFYGMLLILSAGGLLGGGANILLWGSNWLGYAALVYGVGGRAPDTTRAYDLMLNNGGHGVAILTTVGLVARWIFGKRKWRTSIALSILAGICLGLSRGTVEYLAPPLVSVVNWLGDYLAGLS
jgi:hypothetical protein